MHLILSKSELIDIISKEFKDYAEDLGLELIGVTTEMFGERAVIIEFGKPPQETSVGKDAKGP